MLYVFIGTKAQLIKVAPVLRECDKRGVPYRFVFLSQHWKTIEQLLDDFGLRKPDVTLGPQKDIVSLWQFPYWILTVTWQCFSRRKEIFVDRDKRDDFVIVHGDSLSTIIGAILGRLSGRKVAHIEAGLRSFDLFHPFPEEAIRIFTSYLACVHFCPGERAVENLKRHKGAKMNTEHNTLYDAVTIASKKKRSSLVNGTPKKFALCSIHRYENIFSSSRLSAIVELLCRIAETIPILFVLHLPTEKRLRKEGHWAVLRKNDQITLLPRQSFSDFIALLKQSAFLVTDSGGSQEESSYLGKPCLLLRKTTERQDGIGKTVALADLDNEKVDSFLRHYPSMETNVLKIPVSPSSIIVDFLEKFTSSTTQNRNKRETE